MRAIDRKLWRDLWAMRTQALAIVLVIVSGVGVFIMSLSTLDSLERTRDTYYLRNHFADVFSSLKRAPLSMADRIAAIPGVETVETRVVAYVSIDVEGFPDPVSGHLHSLPDNAQGLLNRIYLREGRQLEPGHDDEVLASVEFAQAHGLHPGAKIRATINGRRKLLTIVGTVMSPEYIYPIAPGAMFPDYRHYGVFWMARKPLATAYDMDGAFNNVTLTLRHGANAEDVIDRLDDLLKPYGGIGAYAREDQFSNRFLTEELRQQKTIATVFPIIFFSVAAFLLNVVVTRLISLEREEIAVLKAFGYSNAAIGLHYAKLVVIIVAFGVAGGIGAGVVMGRAMAGVYMHMYSLPYLIYVLRPAVIAAAALISIAVALLGNLFAVRGAARLPPAQAMRPEPPGIYRSTLVERLGLQRWFAQPTRMVLRHIERRPFKSLLTSLGIAFACAIMMIGGFQKDAIDHMVEVQYGMSQREDLMAIFSDPVAAESLYSLTGLKGVEQAEGERDVPVRVRFEHRYYRTSVHGVDPAGTLLRVLDPDLNPIELPDHGVVLTDYLAKRLHVQPGDTLSLEVLEGRRRTVRVPVVGLTKQYLGVNLYMQRAALGRLLDEGDVISSALLRVDPRYRGEVYADLKGMPRVAGVVEQSSAIKAFYATLAETVLFFTFISTLLGATIAFGVVYNSMRIALSERNRELASLRVLGFHRGEIAYILLGELAVLTLAAIPVGLAIGHGLCAYLAYRFQSDLYRIPLVIHTNVYAFAALVVILSAVASAVMIWRNLAHLDMVAVLKTKE